MANPRGKFIVFEGIDGSGTTTQSELLYKYLKKQKRYSHLTHEPSDGPIGTLVRQIFKGRTKIATGEHMWYPGSDLFDEQIAYLCAADRHDHIYNPVDGIVRLLEKGTNVICCRYYFSSMVYQCSTESDKLFVRDLNKRFINPDLVIYLDISADTAMNRMSDRIFADTYETEHKLQTTRLAYLELFDKYEERILHVDGHQHIGNVHGVIINEIDTLLEGALA